MMEAPVEWQLQPAPTLVLNEPDREAWVRCCVQVCDDGVLAGDDLDWEFAFDSRLGHSTGTTGGRDGEKVKETMR